MSATPTPPNSLKTSDTALAKTLDGTSSTTTATGGKVEIEHFRVIIPILFVAMYLELVDFSAASLDTHFILSLLPVILLSWLVSHSDKTIRQTLGAEFQQLRQERDEKAEQYQDAVDVINIVGERFEVAEEEIEMLQSESNQKSVQLQRAVTRIHARSRRLRAAHIEMNRLRTECDDVLAANEAKDLEIMRLVSELQDALEAKSRMEEDMLNTHGELIQSFMRSLARDEESVHATETGPISEVDCPGTPALTFGWFN